MYLFNLNILIMKKVSKKLKSTKLNEDKYSSLNGKMLKKIKGGASSTSNGSTDRVCSGGCGATAAFVK